MTTRILVLSASVGAGHLRAAQAVELALREVVPEATVRNLDVLDSTNAPFRRFYGKFYLDLVNKAPHVLGYFYDLMDQPSRSGKNRADRLRLAVEKLNLRKFVRLLKDEPPDLVINTHFLPAEIIASLRRKDELSVPQVTATTETLGKIVIYEPDRGRKIGHFPTLSDGVYLWLRCNGRAVNDLWAPAFQRRHAAIFARLDPMVTLGVTSPDPTCPEERFAYFRLENTDLPRWHDFAAFLVELTGV